MSPKKKTCFVVMGFRTKTAYYSNKPARSLNLDAAYQNLIKPAVESAGLACIRADEIQHSGVIDVPMYGQLLSADVVIADLSTANANAMYELGVRHALKPFTTIVIAEDQFEYPFDVNHTVIRPYKHLGEDIGVSEAKRFTKELKKSILAIVGKEQVDSPVYTYLKIDPPTSTIKRAASRSGRSPRTAASSERKPTVAALQQRLASAKKASDYVAARAAAASLRKLVKGDAYYVQQHALATYQAELPDRVAALLEAKKILAGIGPEHSLDPETIGLWGAVHKRLWESTRARSALDTSVRSYKRGHAALGDYYNGVNYAYMLDERAHVTSGDDAVADRVEAKRTRDEVAARCQQLVEEEKAEAKKAKRKPQQSYWVVATLWECHFALGNDAQARKWEAQARSLASTESWMVARTEEQLAKLRKILAAS